MKFKKRPVVIDAIRFDGTPGGALEVFDEFDTLGGKFVPDISDLAKGTLRIPTLEGDYTASAGDWIICGVAGEYYPCKPDIFEKTYEPVIDK